MSPLLTAHLGRPIMLPPLYRQPGLSPLLPKDRFTPSLSFFFIERYHCWDVLVALPLGRSLSLPIPDSFLRVSAPSFTSPLEFQIILVFQILRSFLLHARTLPSNVFLTMLFRSSLTVWPRGLSQKLHYLLSPIALRHTFLPYSSIAPYFPNDFTSDVQPAPPGVLRRILSYEAWSPRVPLS